MNRRERFINTLNFKSVDRLPIIEWAPWWDKTIMRWKSEGFPDDISDNFEINKYLGLDLHRQYWINSFGPLFPRDENKISDIDAYNKIKKYLYPEIAFDRKKVEDWAFQQKNEDIIIWITLNGFFWFPRILFGIENHLYSFYDNAELMHIMNHDLLKYNIRVIDEFCQICKPDFITFAEDMSYNHGPMISKELFDVFMEPYYNEMVKKLKEKDIIAFIDTDGNIEKLVPWFMGVGIDGFLPLEKQSGLDIRKLREMYPKIRLIGGYDKMVMSKGEREMKDEFERILPVMKQGGYVPSVDHQTPPEVSFENYKIYVKLLNEFVRK